MNSYAVKLGLPDGEVRTFAVEAETIADSQRSALAIQEDDFTAGRSTAGEHECWVLCAFRTNLPVEDLLDDDPVEDYQASIDNACYRFTARLLDAVEKRIAGQIDALAFDIEVKRSQALAADAVRIALQVDRHVGSGLVLDQTKKVARPVGGEPTVDRSNRNVREAKETLILFNAEVERINRQLEAEANQDAGIKGFTPLRPV